MVAPISWSPSLFSTGRLSPVIMLSSTLEWPLATTPSTGIFSPGRTMTVSPRTTSAMAMSSSTPLRTTRAVLALQAHQLLDRLAGAPLGPRFQQLAQHDQRDDHRRRLEVDVVAQAVVPRLLAMSTATL
jgi:hypothetical protein